MWHHGGVGPRESSGSESRGVSREEAALTKRQGGEAGGCLLTHRRRFGQSAACFPKCVLLFFPPKVRRRRRDRAQEVGSRWAAIHMVLLLCAPKTMSCLFSNIPPPTAFEFGSCLRKKEMLGIQGLLLARTQWFCGKSTTGPGCLIVDL